MTKAFELDKGVKETFSFLCILGDGWEIRLQIRGLKLALEKPEGMDTNIKAVWSVLEFGIAEIPQVDKTWPGNCPANQGRHRDLLPLFRPPLSSLSLPLQQMQAPH